MFRKLLKQYNGWYKLANVLLICLTLLYFPLSNYLMTGCQDVSCLYNQIIGFHQPLQSALQYFIYLPLAFLLLPTIYFRRWLWYVATWGIPVIFLIVSSTSVYDSSLMGGREFEAVLLTILFMVLSGLVTIGFVIYDGWQWYRDKN